METQYYDGSKILSMTDLDKLEPSIYMISSNRSAGKTTYYLNKAMKHFKETGRKTILLYRYQYELNSSHEIFADVMRMNPEYGQEMQSVAMAKGMFYELFLDHESFGYSLSMNNPDSLKKYSPIFTEVDYIIFDEFQPESGKYLPNELKKFQSILLSIARGGGAQSRSVKVFMLSNYVSIMNPYYIQFGIHKRIKADTKFMRGNGWVAEFCYNESASNAIRQNGIARAFIGDGYLTSAMKKEYLFNVDTFISNPSGKNKYLFTIIHDGVNYGVRDCFESGVMYVSKKYDPSCSNVVAFKASDHNQNTTMLTHYSYLWKNIKDAFNNGYLRFDDIQSKNAIFDILAVDMYK
jgi:hypothetical protein